ncbi:Phosphopantothenoylcysteine decarboxylase [Pleurostoma richardsiae]|uniref:Phosphopantothenoylcysteine decarboxylase n=1 Tax=Pleurostoma richardsiae TaxID=41990 RepID=A0AA38RVF2_9PEZI|nr:Phosphopantothenoylcysteine decarboxylase [Pleurostoma richardsiae]
MTAVSTDRPPPPLVVSSIVRQGSSISLNEMPRPRKLRLLVAANGQKDVAYAQAVAVRLSKEAKIVTRAIVDDMTHRLAQEIVCHQNRSSKRCGGSDSPPPKEIESIQQQAFELVEWADLLVLAPIDADNLAKMMCGMADTLLLEVLRGWDASKRILLIPGMSTHMWENPVTKKQLSKLHRKWQWVRVLPPVLWHYENDDTTHAKRVVKWDAFNELIAIIKNQADLLSLGHDFVIPPRGGTLTSSGEKATSMLPPEIWSIIFEYVNDWELAQALGVFTNLEMPVEQGWSSEPKDPNDPILVFLHELEWTLLSADTQAICKKLSEAPPSLQDLSALAIKLIFKFSMTDVLTYIEANCPHLFKCLDGKTIPTKASAFYGRIEILDWWARSPSFLEKQYGTEAIDGASRNGYVHVLEWWRQSGLPLKYTEASLEQASAKGHLHVLEWWREASLQDPSIVLKPGRALLSAAQWGQLDVIRWWEQSGITVGHEEQVCKMASRWGQVDVLELWRELRGDDKISFDVQILVEPTVYSHMHVLDWWKKYAHAELPGMNGRKAKKVEYKTMDIEEALEDSLGDQTKLRRWWAENGLNLGLGTTEWMKSRYL